MDRDPRRETLAGWLPAFEDAVPSPRVLPSRLASWRPCWPCRTPALDAAVVAARLLTGTAPGADFPRADLRVATTRGTNALLEGKGTPVDLYTSKGFESLLEVRDQRRPDLFELSPSLSVPVTKRVIGVTGRLDRKGRELEPLDESDLEAHGETKAVAVAMINSDVAPYHEKRVAEILRDRGFAEVSVSHEIAPMIRLWPRMETTVANAYLTPVMGGFLSSLKNALPEVPLSLMTSSGQLKSAETFRPVDSLLSGPAGGIAGAVALARACDLEQVLTFDMGGTSTDVARISGEPGYRYEHATIGHTCIVLNDQRVNCTIEKALQNNLQW